ncbi:MAG: LysR substrate-binding domain-containing protein [Candidatus Puniceispirillaceae bacterium]
MKTEKLRLRQLEALMAVADHGSITNAASELGISQPAVSRLLSDLGDRLGFTLFDRRRGQLVPSQEVRFLTPDIRRVLELMRQISDVSQEITKRRAGHIRIACLPGFATSHLPDVVAAFLEKRPGVSMTIEPDRPERILEWMIGEQYDFGITDGFAGHPAVESTNLEVRTVCVFPTGHSLSARKIVTPADIATEAIIHTRRDSEFFDRLSNAFRVARVEFNSLIEIRQFTAACELVCKGAGVAVVSELDATKYTSQGLDFRPFRPVVPHTLSLVRPITQQPSMVVLEFMEHFANSLKPFLITSDARA